MSAMAMTKMTRKTTTTNNSRNSNNVNINNRSMDINITNKDSNDNSAKRAIKETTFSKRIKKESAAAKICAFTQTFDNVQLPPNGEELISIGNIDVKKNWSDKMLISLFQKHNSLILAKKKSKLNYFSYIFALKRSGKKPIQSNVSQKNCQINIFTGHHA